MGHSVVRPLSFMVGFWGPEFRGYFLEWCLPSLLGLGNIPSLKREDRHQFVICCPGEDFDAVLSSPLTKQLQQYCSLLWIESGYPKDDSERAKFVHMTDGHRKMLDFVHQSGGIACHLMPDTIYSDRMVETIQRYVKSGARALLTVALRLEAEGLFHELRGRRVWAANEMAPIAARNLYLRSAPYEWYNPAFSKWPSFCYWRLSPNHLIIHSSYFAYLMLDLGCVTKLDHSSFDKGLSIENRWLSDNFRTSMGIYIASCREAMALSWGYLPDEAAPQLRRVPAIVRGYRLRRMRELHWLIGDRIKADLMRHPTIWQLNRNDLTWRNIQPTRRVMWWYFGDVYEEYRHFSPYMPVWPWWIALRAVCLVDILSRMVVRKVLGGLRRGVFGLFGNSHSRSHRHHATRSQVPTNTGKEYRA